jgi:hypothetical protein
MTVDVAYVTAGLEDLLAPLTPAPVPATSPGAPAATGDAPLDEGQRVEPRR